MKRKNSGISTGTGSPREKRIRGSPPLTPFRPSNQFLLSRSDGSTSGAPSALLVCHPPLYQWLELRAEVRHMKGLFANDGRYFVHRSTAVPAQAIYYPKVSFVRTTQRRWPRRTSKKHKSSPSGVPCSYLPMAASGRTRSITIPTVSAKRTGLWGVLPAVCVCTRTQPHARNMTM